MTESEILEVIDNALEAHGHRVKAARMEGPGLYLIEIEKINSPPPLGVHVIDGAGGKDIPR